MAYKKRYNRRYKNKTKKFNKFAYAKTDSRNQAKQIVRLNKKIDNVFKTLKQETIKNQNTGEIKISSNAAAIIPFDTLLNTDFSTYVEFFKGNYTKFIYYNFKFFFNSTNIDLTKGKTLRIIIFQNRYGLDTVPAATDLLYDSTKGVISGFKEGINNNYKILLSKLYNISSDKDYLFKSYNFKKLLGYNRLAKYTTANSKYGRGSIFVMFLTTQQEEFSINWNSSLGRVDTNTF